MISDCAIGSCSPTVPRPLMSQGFHVVACLSGSSFSTSKAKSGSVLEIRYEENLGAPLSPDALF